MGEAGGPSQRRPLRSRQTSWASRALRLALATPLGANAISFLGLVVSALGAAAIWFAGGAEPGGGAGPAWLWLIGALAIQLRLLANLLDGMVAVEGGRGSPTGALWNVVPDRFEDAVFLVAFGHAAGLDWLGWLAALLASLGAYIRTLGVSLGLGEDFSGPMAKPQRMAALTLGCLLAPLEAWLLGTAHAALVILAVVVLGTAVTCARRLLRQAQRLQAEGRDP